MSRRLQRALHAALTTLPIARRSKILLSIGGVLLIGVEVFATLLRLEGSSMGSLFWVFAAGGVVIITAWIPVCGTLLTLAIAFASSTLDPEGSFQIGIAIVAGIVARTCSTPFMTFAGVWYVAWAAIVSGGGLTNLAPVLLTAVCSLIGAVLRAAERRHRTLERELRQQEEQRRRAIAAERTRIAVEMHDVVAHALTVVAMHASVLDSTNDEAERARSQAAIGEVSRQAVNDMRTMLGALHGDVRGDEGTAVAHPRARLEQLADSLRIAGIATTTRFPEQLDLPAPLLLAVVRITQEATTNILKHAPASVSALLAVTVTRTEVLVEVENVLATDSRSRAIPSGFGLVGLQERTKMFGGELTTGRMDNTWRVRAALPIPNAHAGLSAGSSGRAEVDS